MVLMLKVVEVLELEKIDSKEDGHQPIDTITLEKIKTLYKSYDLDAPMM